MTEHYDVAIVGTGFSGAFFLMRYLQHAKADARVLVLERGGPDDKPWQLAHRRTSSIEPREVFVNLTPQKDWLVSPGFGGNSKCWWAGTTRMMPADFQLRTRYGVGDDWPLSYEDLAPHYDVVEDVMQVSGPADSPMPRSRPFPLPPHRLADPDVLLKKAFPDGWFHPMTARASAPTATRGVCCATGVCELCPVDAKFTVQNGLAHIYKDPRVTLRLHTTAEQVETAGGTTATGLVVTCRGTASRVQADLVVLGANAIFNPHILLRSGLRHRLLGTRLHEQMPVDVCLDLKGLKSYNGSTAICGNGYLFYDGGHRRNHAGCLLESWNAPFVYGRNALRTERGRWTERMYIRFLFDDLPREDNTVSLHLPDPRLPAARFTGYSDYAQRGVAQVPRMIDKLSGALPIERIESMNLGTTAAHIQGTVVMGEDPERSIVDRHLVHHRVRNLLVLGASAFPTASPAYPTLTVSALSLWAADHLLAARAA
jgi:choline dehydrogenase-like flavoprotein